MSLTLLSALVLAQFQIVTPGESGDVGPPGILDPVPVLVDAGQPFAPDGGSPDGGALDGGFEAAPDGGMPLDAGPVLSGLQLEAAEAADDAARAAAQAAIAQQKAADALAKLQAAVSGKPAAPASPPEGWGGSANLSLIAFSGNTDSLLVSANVTLTKIFRDGWIVMGHAAGSYGQARPGPGQPVATNAMAAAGQLRGDRVFARSATVYALGGVETDHIDSIELREYVEPGAAIFWLDRHRGDVETLLLRSDFGLRYAHETRFQYYPSELNLGVVQFAGPRLGVAFHVAASKDVAFIQEGELLRDLTSSRLMLNTSTKILAHLVKQFALTVTFLVAYDSSPPLNRLTTDTSLSAGIEMKF